MKDFQEYRNRKLLQNAYYAGQIIITLYSTEKKRSWELFHDLDEDDEIIQGILENIFVSLIKSEWEKQSEEKEVIIREEKLADLEDGDYVIYIYLHVKEDDIFFEIDPIVDVESILPLLLVIISTMKNT